jgi:molybdopterin converting factor subunit 1
MRIQVHLFARARDLAGMNKLILEAPTGVTAVELRRLIAEASPALAGLLARSALAINDDFAEDSTVVPADAEIAVLPPVSGGQK